MFLDFGPNEIKKMKAQLFMYNKEIAKEQVTALIKKQKFQNQVIKNAATRQMEECPQNAEPVST